MGGQSADASREGQDTGDFISQLRKVSELKLVSYFWTFLWSVFRLRLITVTEATKSEAAGKRGLLCSGNQLPTGLRAGFVVPCGRKRLILLRVPVLPIQQAFPNLMCLVPHLMPQTETHQPACRKARGREQGESPRRGRRQVASHRPLRAASPVAAVSRQDPQSPHPHPLLTAGRFPKAA